MAVLHSAKHPRPNHKLQQLRAALAQPQFAVDAAVVGAKRLLIVSVAETLLTLHQQIKAYDKRVNELFKDHPDREVFQSLPGAGPRLAVRMAAELGDHCERFASARFRPHPKGGRVPFTVTGQSSERWQTEETKFWAGPQDRWAYVTAVVD